MKRRALLATVGAASASLAGCTGLLDDDGTDDDSDTDDTPTDGTTSGGVNTPHDLYLANLHEETLRIHVELRRTDTDETVVSGTYELDDGQAAEFENVAGWDGEYEVTATLQTDATATYDWLTQSCPNDGHSRNASLRVGGDDGDDDGFSFVVDECDAIVAGTAASAGPAESFRVEDGDGTTGA
ncbi:hypothetical protein [Haloarchaeobius salinus]|uniref:hypothetical protein n=1 Tax=Haloarchaeobius salinus TaxID=1198298 RepID=UPI00210EE0DE|nr:hypothetical protein [Haloarchaeobius salinus]